MEREESALKDDLAKVRWLLAELPRWDSTSVDSDARAYVDKRYRYIERVLLAAVEDKKEKKAEAKVEAKVEVAAKVAPPPPAGEVPQRGGGASHQKPVVTEVEPKPVVVAAPKPITPPVEQKRFVLPDPPKAANPTPPEATAAAKAAAALSAASFVDRAEQKPPPAPPAPPKPAAARVPPPPAPRPQPKRAQGVPGAVLAAKPPKKSVEDRIAVMASHWHRVWKPFLHESIGWFVGGFLILVGTLYLVRDSWRSMGDGVRAGVVFGLAAGWTLGFAAWGRFLSRREKTKGAARVLKLISAMIAPLAPLAVGAAIETAWFIFVPASLAWAALSAWLAAKVEPDYDAGASKTLPASMGLATAMMGLATLAVPALLRSPLHLQPASLIWLNAIPVGLLVAHARRERKTLAQRGFAFAAMAFATLLFAARLHYELGAAAIAPQAYAPFVALAAVALVRMRTPGHAADVLSVSAVALQGAALGIGLLLPAPGFFVPAAAGAWTCWLLTRERLSHSHRWAYGAYAFGYFAWQSCGQLVPGVVKQLTARLREGFGYSGSASLPPSYDAAYAAVFVIAVGFFAVRALAKHGGVRRLEAEVLLRCTWATAALAGALGMAAIATDVRPALFSAPFLAAFELWVGLKLERAAHTRVGATLFCATAIAAALGFGGHHELTIAAFALLAAVISIPWTLQHRQALGYASVALITLAAAESFAAPATAASTVALLLAGIAAVIVSLNLERQGLIAAAGLLLAVPPRALMAFAPDYAPLALAVAAVLATIPLLTAQRSEHRSWNGRDGRRTQQRPRGEGSGPIAQYLSLPSALAAALAVLWQFGIQTMGGPILFGPVALCAALALALGVRRDEAHRSEASARDLFAMLLLGSALVTGSDEFQAWKHLTPTVSSALAAGLALVASLWAARRKSWRPVTLGSIAVAVAAWATLMGIDAHASSGPALGLGLTLLLATRALLPQLTLPLSSLALLSVSFDPRWQLGVAVLFTAVAVMRELHLGRLVAGPRSKLAVPASLAAALPLLMLVARAVTLVAADGQHVLDPEVTLPAALAALLPFAWTRATRNPASMLFAPVLAAVALWNAGAHGNWVLAALAVVFTRALTLRQVREALFPRRGLLGAEDANVRAQWASRLVLGAVTLCGLSHGFGAASMLPLALALVLAATDGLALRLFFASCLVVPAAAMVPYAALALVAIAFAARHAPKATGWLLGTEKLQGVPETASLLAVAVAGLHCVQLPAGALVPALLLAFTLLVAAVTLGFGALLFASASVLVFLPRWSGGALDLGGVVVSLTALGALAAVLRYPPLGRRLEALVAKLGNPVERGFAFWLWLAGMAGVAVTAVLGSSELCLALLLPASLLLMTPERLESAAAIALLAALVVLRVPAPLASALLSGGALLFAFGARNPLLTGSDQGSSIPSPAASLRAAVGLSRQERLLSGTWTWAARALSLISVGPAFLAAAVAPGAVLPALTLAATLGVCALTFRFGAFAALAAFTAAVAPAYDGYALSLTWLVPVATVSAALAVLLRRPLIAALVERLVSRLAPEPDPLTAKLGRSAAFWPWAGSLAAVAVAALSPQPEYLALLLPAALLLATDVALESVAAFGVLGALAFFRVPAPLSCALLSGSALALQLGAGHGNGGLARVWKWTARSLSLAAIGPALLYQSQAAQGLAAPALLLAATLACAALVLRLRALFTLGALSAVVLPALDGRHLAFEWLIPAATVTALAAALLRLPVVVKASERVEDFLARPLGGTLGELDRPLAFWLWLGAALSVAFGALSTQPSYLPLLLPAALLLATDVALESMAAFGLLAALLVVRAPAPLACAVLSGSALALQLGARHGKGQLSTAWKWSARALSLAAVLPAAWMVVTSPAGAVVPALTLAATFVAVALVLGLGAIFTLAAVAAVVLPALGGDGLELGWLAPAATVVAALAAALRLKPLAKAMNTVRGFVAEPLDDGAAGWFWLAAALSVGIGMLAGQTDHALLLLPAGLLLVTETTLETAVAIGLLASLLGFRVPAPLSGAVLAMLGLAFSFGGRRGQSARSQTWFHAGWALALVALPLAHPLASPFTPLAWALSACTAWVVANERPELEWLGWLASLAAGHVALFFAGVRLSTGAPHELILPWVASFSLVTGALAMVLGQKNDVRARIGQLMMAWGLAELSLGLGLLPGAHLREAVVVCVALVLASGPLFFRAGKRDDALASVLSGLVPAMLLLTVHLVGLGGRLGSFEAFAALVLGAIAGGLHDVLRREKKPGAARVALAYALLWPLAGLLAAPHQAGWTLAGLLLAQSLHYAWFGRLTGWKLPAVASAVAFNAAMVCGWLTTGFHSWEYLAIPFGLSLLGLVKVFGDELSEGVRVKLRAVAVTLVYAAAAVRPLTFDHSMGLFVCVLVCVIGIGAGVALKVRSYVYLGTAFMVTSVVANLVRFGVREPRVGAIFLSSLGLLVVGFMVLVTTRRAELLEKYKAARAMLQQWDA